MTCPDVEFVIVLEQRNNKSKQDLEGIDGPITRKGGGGGELISRILQYASYLQAQCISLLSFHIPIIIPKYMYVKQTFNSRGHWDVSSTADFDEGFT